MDRTSTFLVVYAIVAAVVIAAAAGFLAVMRRRGPDREAGSVAPSGVTEREWLLRAQTETSLRNIRSLRRRIAETREKSTPAPAKTPTTVTPAPDDHAQHPAETLRLGLRDCTATPDRDHTDINARLARWDRLSDVERLVLCNDVEVALQRELNSLELGIR